MVGFGPELSNAVLNFQLVLPPIPLSTTAAEQMYYGLFFHEHIKPLVDARSKLFDLSPLCVGLSETDATLSNERLEAFLTETARPKVWKLHFFCRLHQLQLTEAALLTHVGLNVLSRLYGLTILMHTSGYFLRLSPQLPCVLGQSLSVSLAATSGPAPEEARHYSKELIEYLMAHYRPYRKKEAGGSVHERVAAEADSGPDYDGGYVDIGKDKYRAKLRCFFDAFNGLLWQPTPEQHYSGPACCPSPQKSAAKLSDSARKLVFAAAPNTPTSNKWSKLGPALDWVLLGMLTHSLLLKVMLSLRVSTSKCQGRGRD